MKKADETSWKDRLFGMGAARRGDTATARRVKAATVKKGRADRRAPCPHVLIQWDEVEHNGRMITRRVEVPCTRKYGRYVNDAGRLVWGHNSRQDQAAHWNGAVAGVRW